MKYDIKDIQKAIDTITKNGGPTEIDMTTDHLDRLSVKYTDTMDGDSMVITIYPSETSKMATITKTTRL
jgi:hypothetical protein